MIYYRQFYSISGSSIVFFRTFVDKEHKRGVLPLAQG